MEKKRIIIISAIAAAVLAAIIGVTVLLVSLFAFNGDAAITIGSAEGKKGDIVRVSVKISNNPGFAASLMNFKYDAEDVKYIGYEKGDFLKDYEFVDEDGVLKFLGLEENDVDDNGLLFNLKFEILNDSAKCDIGLETVDMTNYAEQSIKPSVKSGKITAK